MLKQKIDTRELAKTLGLMLLLTAGITAHYYRTYHILMLKDSLFLCGLFFFCMGLFRIVRWLGLFDSTIYGTKKLFGKTRQSFVEFTQDNPYTRRFLELLLLGMGFILLSFLF